MLTTSLDLGGIVLCGGQSRRMRQSKAWLPCSGEHLLQRVIRLVREAVGPVVAAARPGYDIPPLPDDVAIVHDTPGAAGPLAGMAAGFDFLTGRCEAAFVVACDHPLLRPAFITRLAELLGSCSAVVPRHEERLHPLAAIYRLDTLRMLEELMRAGEDRATAFAERCSPRIAQAVDFADCDPELESLRNFNNRADYAALIAELDHQARRGGRSSR